MSYVPHFGEREEGSAPDLGWNPVASPRIAERPGPVGLLQGDDWNTITEGGDALDKEDQDEDEQEED